jgi:hypothetical protein
VLLAASLVLTPSASAQPENPNALSTPLDTIAYIEGVLNDACDMREYNVLGFGAADAADLLGLGEAFDSMLYLCDYNGVVRRTTRATSGLFRDIDRVARDAAAGAYDSALARFVRIPFLPSEEGATPRSIEQELTDLLEAVRTGLAEGDPTAPTVDDYRELAEQYLTDEADNAVAYFDGIAANPENFPEGSAMRTFAEALASNPTVNAITYGTIEQSLALALERVDTETNFQSGALAAEAFLDTSDYQQTVARTLDPTEGTAAALVERASASTSTRESINELARGWADFMRQDAVFSATTVDGLKQLVRQQVVTNQALRTEAVARIQERESAVQAAQNQVTVEIVRANVEVQEFYGALTSTTDAVGDMLNPSPYPDEFCARFGCPEPRTGDR